MSLLRRTNSPHNRHDEVLRALLEKMSGDEQSTALLQDVLKALPNLTDEEKQRLNENPAEFLFPKPVEQPAAPAIPPKIPVPTGPRPPMPSIDYLARRVHSNFDKTVLLPEEREAIQPQLEELLNAILAEENLLLTRDERDRLIEAIAARTVGFGAIDACLRDDSVSEIRVIGPKHISIVQKGHAVTVPETFDDEEALLIVINRLIVSTGQHIDENKPVLHLRTPDGSLIAAIARPPAQPGPALYIQKASGVLQGADLLRSGTLSPDAMAFLSAAMNARLNIVVAGQARSGKTALITALADTLDATSTVVTIEPSAELRLQSSQVLSLQTLLNRDGQAAVTARQLAEHAVHFHPERVILGGMNGTGLLPLLHTGVPFLIEATAWNSEAALNRLQTALLMDQADLSREAARSMVHGAIDLVVEMERINDGSRKVTSIAALEPDGRLIKLFEGFDAPNGLHLLRAVPQEAACLDRIEAAGYAVKHLFAPKAAPGSPDA